MIFPFLFDQSVLTFCEINKYLVKMKQYSQKLLHAVYILVILLNENEVEIEKQEAMTYFVFEKHGIKDVLICKKIRRQVMMF